MAAAFTAALGLDRPELQKSCIAVLEHGNADSSFVLSCIMWDWLVGRSTRAGRALGTLLPRVSESNSAVLLITCHHSLSHYRIQSLKLGLNLTTFKQKGMFESFDLTKVMSDALHSSDAQSELFHECDGVVLQNLYTSIRKHVLSITKSTKSVCVVIEGIDNVLCVGANMSDVMVFLNYMCGLVHEIEGLSLIISAHVSKHEEDESVLGAYLKHTCNLTVAVSGLQTGLYKDISGSLNISSNFASPFLYHYRLLDRQVKLFAPGTTAV